MEQEIKNAFGRVFYRIAYHAALDLVEAQWHGTASQQDLRNAVVAGLEVHEHTGCAYRLNDNTSFSGPWADAVPWLETEWLPRAYVAGIRFLAHVARPGSFGELAGEALLQGKIGAQIQVAVFATRQEAMNWLQAQQTKVGARAEQAQPSPSGH